MALAGKIALFATQRTVRTARTVLGETYYPGARTAPASTPFRLLASAPEHDHVHRSAAARSSLAAGRAGGAGPLYLQTSCARSAAARSSVVVACATGGNSSYGAAGKGGGAAGKGNGAETQCSTANAADSVLGYYILEPDEAQRAARIVSFFLFVQKAFYLREKKVSDLRRKYFMLAVVSLCLWVGLMCVKGVKWAELVAGSADKAYKMYKIVKVINAIFK